MMFDLMHSLFESEEKRSLSQVLVSICVCVCVCEDNAASALNSE